MANYTVTDAQLSSIANAIREKGGTSASLAFPSGFVSAIGSIPAGNGIDALVDGTFSGEYSASISYVRPYAFYGYSSISRANLPNCVSIGSSAFYGCTALSSISIPNCESIGNYAFGSCSTLMGLDLPNVSSVIALGLTGNSSLSYLSVPECQYFDTQITSTIISELSLPNCTYVGYITAAQNTRLRKVYAPECLRIGSGFRSAYNLSDVYFPKVTRIGNMAFQGTGLSEASFPELSYIEGDNYNPGAFGGCRSLVSGYFPELKYIGSNTFKSCRIMNVYIPKVETVCSTAFQSCSYLTSVSFPSPVLVSTFAFVACSSLASAFFYGETTVGSSAFANCISLKSITIPSSVICLMESAFENCSSMTSLTINNGLKAIDYNVFCECNSLKSVSIPNSVIAILGSAFACCTSLTSVTLSNKLEAIADEAFYKCTSLKSINIPNSVTSIGSEAFYGCSNLSSVTIGSGVTYIDDGAFSYCSSLKTINIPNGVETISAEAFYHCKSLTTVGIGSGIKEIVYDSFSNCEELTDVYCFAENVPKTYYDVFNNSYIEYATLHVPSGSLDAYKAKTPWNGFMNIVKISTPKVKLNKSEFSLEKGKTETLSSKFSPTSYPDKSVSWKSSDKTVATVTSDGKVKGIKAGTATITCTSVATGAKATCKVTVIDGSVKLNKTKVTLEKGKTVTLKATVTPSTLTDKSVTWKSSNTAIATVSTAGKVKGVKAGTATITCTSKATGLSATCKVTVGYVKLDKTEAVVEKTKTLTLKATVYPSSLTDKSVTWKSSNTAVATVTSSGKVKGVKAGKATITCTSKATGLSTTCKVIVGYVKLDKTTASVKKGSTVTLKATVYPSTLSDQSVKWKSSNTSVATVSSSGKVKGVKAGTATITCTSVATGLSKTCKVTVTAASGTRSLEGDDDELTNIEEIFENVNEDSHLTGTFDVYDLSGRKVAHQVTSLDGLPNGIYIVNGKKILKKD